MNLWPFLKESYPDIGSISTLQPWHSGPNSTSYMLKTQKGMFVFKQPKTKEPNRIEKMCRTLSFLKKKGAKVPEPIGRRRGTYTGEDASYLVSFSRGTAFCGSLREKISIAKELALLHALLAQVRIPYPWAPNAASYKHLATKELEDIQKKVRQKTRKDAFDKLVASKKGLLEHAFSYYSPQRKSRPLQLIHYDVQPGNVLFSGGRVALILDFDALRKGGCMQELAFAAFRFSFAFASDLAESVARFAAAYGEQAKKPAPSLPELRYDFIAMTLDRVSYMLRMRYQKKSALWSPDFGKQLEFIAKALTV